MDYKIILVDDDANILTSVSMAFEEEGFEVKTYNDGIEALRGLQENPADLAIIDIKMPRMDGLELLTKIRQFSSIPIIFLSSKDDEVDQLLGLRSGADDYITKPFSQRLLIERTRALLRRIDSSDVDHEITDSIEILTNGKLFLDPKRHYCMWNQKPVVLTVTEFLILQSLARHPGHVKNREQLMDAAYGDNIYVDDRTIDSHIKRLRKKFKSIDKSFNQIETLYGIGYRYRE